MSVRHRFSSDRTEATIFSQHSRREGENMNKRGKRDLTKRERGVPAMAFCCLYAVWQ